MSDKVCRTHCFLGALCNPPENLGGRTPYEAFSALPMGRANDPILPGKVEGASFASSCQHSRTELLFRPVRAVMLRAAGMFIGGTFCAWAAACKDTRQPRPRLKRILGKLFRSKADRFGRVIFPSRFPLRRLAVVQTRFR